MARLIRTVIKFRSERGAAHITPNYSPNHMDARVVVEAVRWLMNETLRVFWNGDREAVARVIRELLQFDVPAIGNFEGRVIVQRTDLSAEEEVLLLLHFAGETGYTRGQLGSHAMCSPSSVTRAIQALSSADCRESLLVSGERYVLTDLGHKRIREHLASRLLLQ